MPAMSLLGVLLVAPVLQEQDPGAKAKTAEATAKPLSDQDARTAVAAFKKSSRNKKKARLAERIEAVQTLGRDQHKLLVKPLAQAVLTDRSMAVRKTAAELLGHQPSKEARRALLMLIDKKQPPEVLATLITSLSRAGYTARDWDKIRRLFERQFGEKYAAVQQAILRLVTAHKEKQSWRLLLRHVDEPIPANVDDASNPPASYWEQRWKAWRIWRSDAREALFAISGQRFSSSAEARIWIRKNGAKVGLK